MLEPSKVDFSAPPDWQVFQNSILNISPDSYWIKIMEQIVKANSCD
jgi:hypothetical protein